MSRRTGRTKMKNAMLPALAGAALLAGGLLAQQASAAENPPQGTAGAACSSPLWTTWKDCPSRKIPVNVSGGVAATMAGELTVERPTLISIGLDWRINGDENRNAAVAISYRAKGETAWRTGLTPLRLQNENVSPTNVPPLQYKVPNMFSGSLFDLKPDTEYEVRLVLSDPDGVKGMATRTVSVRPRAEPTVPAGGKVYHVYPYGYTGQKQEPSFMGLNAAYYLEGWRHADWSNVSAPRVQPGDVILIHAGVYKDTRTEYGTNAARPSLGTPFDGTYYLTQSGTPERPIIIKGAGDGEAIFDGDGNYNLFNLMAGNYNYFEGITVRNTEVGFILGMKNIIGSSGFSLKHSKVENIGRGVYDDWGGSKDVYIADNVFTGRHDPTKLLGWGQGAWAKYPGYPEKISGPLGSEYAVKIYGQGHVVAYNSVSFFHDGIDIASYADPDGSPFELPDRIPVSIDIYNNDVFAMGDNCIEADGGARNIRVLRNRCFNSAGGALSAQPFFGGPLYFVRNIVMQGTGGTLKFSITPSGILTYQNTFISATNLTNQASNVHFRNNLLMSQGGEGPSFSVNTYTNYSSSDYNGFRPGAGVAEPFAWNSPDFKVRSDYKNPFVARKYKTLAEYQAATGQDRHSIVVDYNVFTKFAPAEPADMQRLYYPRDYDFSLKPGSAPIDAGAVLANITDGFTGKAPDLGALEAGLPAPHYGPRP